MSADNGIYILETKGPEYRVKYACNIGSIYGKFNDETSHWNGNLEMIKSVFAETPKFSQLNQALDKASELGYDGLYLEDGICHIRDFKDLDFNSL